MKSFAVLALGAGVAMAQSLSDLPQCGQTCINNMISIASSEFNCASGDNVCYCSNVNFGYGVRDCSLQACSSSEAAAVIAYGATYCQGALASASTTGSALAPLTSALATLTTGGPSAITTSALVGTVTGTDGSTFETTTGFSTIYSSAAGDASSVSASISSAASSVSESLASAASSASASLASAASSARGSLTSAASGAASSGASALSSIASDLSSLASEVTGGSTATSTAGAAPLMTGLPFAGAAGMAAWLLL